MKIVIANDDYFDDIWLIFNAVVSRGDTYVYLPNTTKKDAYRIWMIRPLSTYICLNNDNKVIGTYYIKSNYEGLGSHVCSCGYMVHPNFRRQGVASYMCQDSQLKSKQMGFIQY